jgi:NAD(P)H-quinone oxidoreductase subunit 5
MNLDLVISIVLLSPLAFIATAIASWFQPGFRPKLIKNLGIGSAVVSIISALIGSVALIQNGFMESALIGFEGIGLSIRLDSVSILMFSMIAVIGFVVVKFSLNYLDGDHRQGRFIGRLAATIASVQFLVLAGNLGILLLSWILTSISLHRLLVFYHERPGAIVAARKKFIMARFGDVSLFVASLLLYFQFGTGNLETIFTGTTELISTGSITAQIEIAGLFLVLAALFKSAQFPTHGWLIEVMETPTPVSALLHAGLLNAGPFLLIRMAFVMEASSYASVVIIAIGGFTALFASLAFLTQTSVKTALGYSSVAHMGFSLFVCGLGVYHAAMLHLMAHSFYKAHSFLSSGSIIDRLRATKVAKAERIGSPFRILLGFILAAALYTGSAMIWGIDPVEEVALFAIGAIIVMGLTTLIASAFDSNGSLGLLIRASLLAVIVAASFFTLESGAHYLLQNQIPEMLGLSLTEKILTGFVLAAFAAVVLVQILAPVLNSNPAYIRFAIHLRNGFYANAIFDRLIGALRVQGQEELPDSADSLAGRAHKESFELKELERQNA